MTDRRQFPEATKEELRELYAALVDTAILWAKERNFGGLSCASEWNLYGALSQAVHERALSYYEDEAEPDPDNPSGLRVVK